MIITNKSENYKELVEILLSKSVLDNLQVGDWSYKRKYRDFFTIYYKQEEVVICEDKEIIYVDWGTIHDNVQPWQLLRFIFDNRDDIILKEDNIQSVDGLIALNYENAGQLCEFNGCKKYLKYPRIWVAKRLSKNNKDKYDFVLYDDCGNSWCEILMTYKSVTEKEFINKVHKDYKLIISK